MGRPKRLYPLGKYRLRTPKEVDKDKAYPVELEYTWNRQIIRKTTNVFVKVADWNQNGNQGRGEIRASYGGEFKRLNQLLLARVERIDSQLAEYHEKHPNQITADVVSGLLADKPLARRDQGKDFVDFTLERLSSDYSRNRIGRSRYENGKSCMNIFQTFLRATKQGTYRSDAIYVGDMIPELLDSYIVWRKEIKQNSDATINHALTPILKACAYASEMSMIDPAVNARIQDMRIVTKVSLSEEEVEFDGKSLAKEQVSALLEYYKTCQEPRRKEFLEMFFFAFHACGLRVVDVMALQWKHIDFARKELRKIMIKTNKRHVIPLTEPALRILQQWQEKRAGCRYVFDLVKETLDLDDAEALYKARNNATKCINQSLAVVGEQIGLPFSLSMHAARHSFAVFALNKGLSMSVVSRLLGHGSTDVTEKVYARFLPETLSAEVARLKDELTPLEII
ncbi:tyrosine-type recombinase/integrase [Bacteroides fragilis]|uniref:tyrosine-type recombinase/integrase n=1 Tax=Bacteroides fragilis TaxID=817 RepID=UPI001CE1B400|nr:tyrosine-type recombinase/integrase [Bacteroides fragilis]MCA5593487.1 tyrosine-type recombinase/integrase [Bacteroides fragilis]